MNILLPRDLLSLCRIIFPVVTSKILFTNNRGALMEVCSGEITDCVGLALDLAGFVDGMCS